MERIRVLLAAMPPMLTDIVRAIVVSQDDFEFVGEAAATTCLARAAQEVAAEVVVLGAPADFEAVDYVDILCARPWIRIVEIDADGRRAVLHELRLHITPLGEVSPATLIAAIRSRSAMPDRETAR